MSEIALDAEEPGSRRPRRRSAVSCLVVLAVFLAVLGGVFFAVTKGIDAFQGQFSEAEDYPGPGTGTVLVEVGEGDSAADIAATLAEEDVVASVEAFTTAAAAEPRSRGIQVGFYELKRKMTADDALAVLVDNTNLIQSSVTVPEGLRVVDIVRILGKDTDFAAARYRKVLDRPASIGLPGYADGSAEGYLFPATYAFAPNATPRSILTTMVDRWRQAAAEADLEAAAERLGYTPGELMTVASLIEAEANRAQDRGKVARVIYNRLESDVTGGLLQIDATVNYALGRDLGLGLTTEDLDVDDPYNTRRFPGLPPGPIEAPGDAAIAAAANPSEGDFVYYVTVNLKTGETRFTDDYDEFLDFKADYRAYCADHPEYEC